MRIRCQCGPVLSDLEMEIQGLGSLHLSPYDYVNAPLYTDSHGEIGNGNERGITFSLEPVYGKQDVTFLFLPGCDFDFREFRFF